MLEAVTESEILAGKGRPNFVFSVETGQRTLGRFGLKADQPNLKQQIANAFVEDIGVTSALFPAENCPPSQSECRRGASAPELTDAQLDAVVTYIRALAPPARRKLEDPRVKNGEGLFHEIGCSNCHRDALHVADFSLQPALNGVEIHPYTDLLLHDMGDGLADGREDFEAGPETGERRRSGIGRRRQRRRRRRISARRQGVHAHRGDPLARRRSTIVRRRLPQSSRTPARRAARFPQLSLMFMGAKMTRLLTSTAISGGVLLSLLTTTRAQTPLPPIEVRAPKAFELGQIKVGERRLGVPTKVAQPGAGTGVGGVGAPPPAWVPSEKTDNGPTPRQHTDAFGGYTITNRQMETFARPTLDSAVNIAPGVNSQISGNSRNEQNIYVRGFDRWQVPLTVDGVRVYLPVDNKLDFARFLTADIAEVQIAKGYVSVLDGPGGMGGQINLVTRRPTREIEAEWRTQFEFGRDGTFLGPMTYGFAGTKKDLYYAQLSGTFQNYDGWMLPASYRSTLAQGWGFRSQSYTQDYNVNARVGMTPNATDEYSLSFSRQEGQKGAPLHTTDPIATQRFWRWPYWRVQNLYFLSKTSARQFLLCEDARLLEQIRQFARLL